MRKCGLRAMSHRYYNFSSAGHHVYDDGTLEKRWLIDKHMLIHQLDNGELYRPRRVVQWDPRFTIECDGKGPIEDMPWVTGATRPIVSDRLRCLLEERAPGHAQYLPVKLILRRKQLRVGPYWLANWLYEVECHDEELTEWLPTKDSEGHPMIGHLVVDPTRVPRDRIVFLIKYAPFQVLIRGDLKEAMELTRMKGPQFDDVPHSGDLAGR